jgi:2-polyprenyl-3-methyl-5-hydroxy-6-metoxy-1,4-benzoquinol methylase
VSNLDEHVGAYQGNNLYDFDNEILLNWYPKRVYELAPNAQSILELGLGHGFSTNFFSDHFTRHVVIEGSNAVIDNFRKQFPESKATIIKSYFEEYEHDELFDVIVMGFILEHVDNPVQILNHFKKFIAPNGKIFIAVPNAESLNRRLGYISEMLPDVTELSANDYLLGHKRYYTLNSLLEELDSAGYSIDRVEGIYLKPFMSSQMLALDLDKKILRALCTVGINYPELCCGIFVEVSQ